MTNNQLLIITAIKSELKAVSAALPRSAQNESVLICGGVGTNSSARVLQMIQKLPNPPRLICVTGFCGGLKDGLEVGDVVLANVLLDGCSTSKQPINLEASLVKKLSEALSAQRMRYHIGAMISAPSVITQCERKRALAAASGAIAVDMESFTFAAGLNSRETRLCALRVVSDSATDELPPEIGDFLNSNGEVNLSNVASFGLRHPRNTKMLWRLKNRNDKATAALTAAWQNIWTNIFMANFI